MSAQELLNLGFSKEMVVLIISALPVFELRGAIPVAINIFQFPWYYSLLLALIGNLLPVPFVLMFAHSALRQLGKIGFFDRGLSWLLERTRRKGQAVERYKRIGLALFVAVPLPATGAWTGSLVAVVFGLKFGHAFVSISLGVLIAGVVVTCLSLLGWWGAAIAGIGLGILTISGLWKKTGTEPEAG